MTLLKRHGTHGPSELARLQAEIARLTAEVDRLNAVINSDQSLGPGGYAYWRNRFEIADAELRRLRPEIARLTAERDEWHERAVRLSGGLVVISGAPKTVGSSVLRSIAYDIALNCMDAETAEYQIKRRAGIRHEQSGSRE